MALPADVQARLDKVVAAFTADGFTIQSLPDPLSPGQKLNYCLRNGWIGVSARHSSSGPDAVTKYKQAYDLEGHHAAMGCLLGIMAEPEIARMTTEYRVKAIGAFVAPEARQSGLEKDVEKALLGIVSKWVDKMKPDIPAEFHEEIKGIVEGCQKAKANTAVTEKYLWELNFGPDAVLAHVYTGKFLARSVSPRHLRVPLHCNFFAVPGDGNRRLFGRDFIFPNADVYQDVACMIVYRPVAKEGRHAFVSQTAPGIIGSIAAVNARGVAIGIDMTASHLCNARRPGFNALLLSRYCMELADSSPAASRLVVEAQRGVAWLYVIADAAGSACVVEAGRRLKEGKKFPYLNFISHYYKRRLPRVPYIRRMQEKYGNPAPDRGAVVRTAGYKYPIEYIRDWNKGLWNAFDRDLFQKLVDMVFDIAGFIGALFTFKWKSLFLRLRKLVMDVVVGVPYSPDYFGPRDYIDATWQENHCPGPFYFAPQRESRPDVLVATNNFISPEMRLVGMNTWTAIVAHTWYDDFQWRYDELNNEVLNALDAHPNGLDDATAWSVINFLTSRGPFRAFHDPDESHRWQEVQVQGSVNLCDLTTRKLKSLYGYYGDDPVTITLPAYL
ncbi:MAG: carcinine hydrolase/isopenicillin-N N-acyltransferase family protein [Spirochaetia bacterium]